MCGVAIQFTFHLLFHLPFELAKILLELQNEPFVKACVVSRAMLTGFAPFARGRQSQAGQNMPSSVILVHYCSGRHSWNSGKYSPAHGWLNCLR